MSAFKQKETPNQYICPISLEIMVDPVICEDGYTYERTSIINLPNNLSPMTRQQINKSNLIPNRALKEIINKYVQENNIVLPNITVRQEQLTGEQTGQQTSRINQLAQERRTRIHLHMQERLTQTVQTTEQTPNRLDTLINERQSMLARFEQEQRQAEEARRQTIMRERVERIKREEEEAIRREIARREQAELSRVLTMFNTKMPTLSGSLRVICPSGSGNISIYPTPAKKIELTLNIIQSIKNEQLNTLYEIYKKIITDIIWIKKYVIGYGSAIPYVDYVFDHVINDLDEKIEKQQKHIDDRSRTNSWNNNQYFSEESHAKTHLQRLKNFKTTYNKPREYYYVNLENSPLNFRKLVGSIYCNHSPPPEPHQKWVYDQTYIITNFMKNLLDKYNIRTNVEIPNPYPHNGGQPRMTLDLIQAHKDSIILKRQAHVRYGCHCNPEGSFPNAFFEKEDYDGLLNLANVLIELIEFLRPDLVIKMENEV